MGLVPKISRYFLGVISVASATIGLRYPIFWIIDDDRADSHEFYKADISIQFDTIFDSSLTMFYTHFSRIGAVQTVLTIRYFLYASSQ